MTAVFAAGWYLPGSPHSVLRHPGTGLFAMLISAIIGLAGCVSLKSSLSAFPEPRQRRLVTTGIYSVLRHPMYAGLLVLAAGWILWTGSVAAMVASFLLWLLLKRKATTEDGRLGQIYSDHADYAARTWCIFSGKRRRSQADGRQPARTKLFGPRR